MQRKVDVMAATEGFEMPHNSPGKLQHDEFRNQTFNLLYENVKSDVQDAVLFNVPKPAMIKKIIKSIPKFQQFLLSIDALIDDIGENLTPQDVAFISGYILHKLQNSISERLLDAIAIPTVSGVIPEITLPEELFIETLSETNVKIKEILERRANKAAAAAAISKVEHHSHRRLRRLDSLCELLELNSSDSACVAAAIDQGNLIISANNSGDKENIELIEDIKAKFALIRDFLRTRGGMPIVDLDNFIPTSTESKSASDETTATHLSTVVQTYYTENLKVLAADEELQTIVESLQSISASTHDVEDLKQNLRKLIKTFYLDVGPFTKAEKDLLLHGEYKLLLPEKDFSVSDPLGVEPQIMKVVQYMASGVDTARETQYSIGVFPDGVRESHVHAEQMLLYVLRNILRSEGTDVGLSRPCCKDCDEVFAEHSTFLTRGTSNARFPNTIKLNGSVNDYLGSPTLYAKKATRHEPSPGDTPGEPPISSAQKRQMYTGSSSLYAIHDDGESRSSSSSDLNGSMTSQLAQEKTEEEERVMAKVKTYRKKARRNSKHSVSLFGSYNTHNTSELNEEPWIEFTKDEEPSSSGTGLLMFDASNTNKTENSGGKTNSSENARELADFGDFEESLLSPKTGKGLN